MTKAIIILTFLSLLPSNEIQIKKPENFIIADVSAYSSSVDETDDTPFITASGKTVENGIIANNCLSFGTEVEFEGNQYIVQDRMNKRYGCEKFDIWLPSKEEAQRFGVAKGYRIEIQ